MRNVFKRQAASVGIGVKKSWGFDNATEWFRRMFIKAVFNLTNRVFFYYLITMLIHNQMDFCRAHLGQVFASHTILMTHVRFLNVSIV
ncbi:hypothetical protein EATA6166_21690 [Enterobacter asburiae]|nr:hypothetical protein EATA6166_21690 [Enterobacter asburiae]